MHCCQRFAPAESNCCHQRLSRAFSVSSPPSCDSHITAAVFLMEGAAAQELMLVAKDAEMQMLRQQLTQLSADLSRNAAVSPDVSSMKWHDLHISAA